MYLRASGWMLSPNSRQKFAVDFDAPKWLLQVMARRKSELLKILIGAPHLFLHARPLGNVIVRFQYVDQVAFFIALGDPRERVTMREPERHV
jgi:hypothetical protein